MNFLIALLLFFMVALAGGSQVDGKLRLGTLFSTTPYVAELDAPEFDKYIYCQGALANCQAKLILFYEPKSKINQDYVPLIKEVAESSRNWGHLIRIIAVNCGAEENQELCKQNGFKRMAVLKYFNRNIRVGQAGQSILSYNKASVLFEKMVEKMTDDLNQGGYQDWPHLVMLPKETSYTELWDAQDFGRTHLLVVFTNKEMDIQALDFVIDTKKKAPELEVRVAQNNSELAKMFSIRRFPTFLMFRQEARPRQEFIGFGIPQPPTPEVKKYANLNEEYAELIKNLDLEFYPKYSKSMQSDRAEAELYDSYPTKYYIYYPDNESRGKAPSDLNANDYNGIEFRLKSNVEIPVLPKQQMALKTDVNGAGGVQFSAWIFAAMSLWIFMF
ncbi:Sulfhydryl oxidase 2 [Aphelenchoides bicaudatus]|nr:Sulfhydryl oxidase 2 [Aphelenchoides bicaudatus]